MSYYKPSTSQYISINDENLETHSRMQSVYPSDSITRIVGGRRAVAVTLLLVLTACGHYDDVPTITTNRWRSASPMPLRALATHHSHRI